MSATNRLMPSSVARAASRSNSSGSEATTLPGIGHHEGDLGLVAAVAQTVEPRDADDLPFVDGDERLAVHVVDVGEPVQLLIAQIRVHAEEPQPDRLTGQRVVELIQPIDVARAHRLDVDRRAISKHDWRER